MSTKVVLGNLPDGTKAEEIEQVLKKRGWPVLSVKNVEEGSKDRRGFVVDVDLDAATVKSLTSKKRQRSYKGKEFTVYVPLLMK